MALVPRWNTRYVAVQLRHFRMASASTPGTCPDCFMNRGPVQTDIAQNPVVEGGKLTDRRPVLAPLGKGAQKKRKFTLHSS
jgi:hypothetical protein